LKIEKNLSHNIVEMLVSNSQRNPNNFSPLHIILQIFKRNAEMFSNEMLLKLLQRPVNDALIEFAISFLLIAAELQLKQFHESCDIAREIIPPHSFYLDII
jgi:hypothetical protein